MIIISIGLQIISSVIKIGGEGQRNYFLSSVAFALFHILIYGMTVIFEVPPYCGFALPLSQTVLTAPITSYIRAGQFGLLSARSFPSRPVFLNLIKRDRKIQFLMYR